MKYPRGRCPCHSGSGFKELTESFDARIMESIHGDERITKNALWYMTVVISPEKEHLVHITFMDDCYLLPLHYVDLPPHILINEDDYEVDE